MTYSHHGGILSCGEFAVDDDDDDDTTLSGPNQLLLQVRELLPLSAQDLLLLLKI